MYNIKNAFLEQFIPLSDDVHGPFRMMPPELLHTSGSGLIMYMFESLHFHLGGGIDCDYIDQEHVVVNDNGAHVGGSKSNAVNLILRLFLYHILHTMSS